MALTKKVYQVNGEVRDKYLRSLVTWVFIIVPVYGISALADFIVFNTIEFWSGKNPVASGEKDFQYAQDGEKFQVHAQKSGEVVRYTVARFSGGVHVDTLTIDWNLKDGSSSGVLAANGHTTEYQARLVDGKVQVASPAQPGALRTAFAR